MISYLFQIIIKGLIVSLVLFFIIIGIQYFLGRVIKLDSKLINELLFYIIYGIVLSTINSVYFNFINNRVNWDNWLYLKKYRILIGFIGSVFVTLLGIFLIRFTIKVLVEGLSIRHFITNENKTYYLISLLITIIVSLVFHLIYFNKAFQENKLKEQKIIAGTASAKFETLKNQIDPHFLFNSLNVLSSLIDENPQNAQRFTTALSKVYRYVLEQKDKDLVPIEEELAFAKTYINLLQMRFENCLTYEVTINNLQPEAKVVPLSLQLLLENAVKHNIISEQKPLHIQIFIENDALVIQNNFQKKAVLQDGQGVGIQNIISRYNIVTDRKVAIEQNEHTFTVKLPILTKQVTIMENSNYDAENAYYKAKRQVDELRTFYTSLISYCLVIPLLIFINLRFNPQYHWFWFPALSWGFGLSMKGFRIFGYGTNWEERKIQQILNKEDSKQNWK